MRKPIGSGKSTFMLVLLPLVTSMLVLLPFVASGFAQRKPSRLPSSLQIHPSARSLIESYEKLVAGTGVSICNVGNPGSPQTYNVSSDINTGYSRVRIPYTSYYMEPNPYFRTIWADEESNYAYYGACPPPSPIVYPLKDSINTENHVFAARLIPVGVYQAFKGEKTYVGLESVGQVYIQDIRTISDVYLEGDRGYIATTEPANYNNTFSSKGIVVLAQLKNKTAPEIFYIINNYDTGGTLDWKFKTCWLLDKVCR
jgi:hypothetical protein